MSDRPNVLFLMSDQHRADVAGFAGDEVVRTPTLDSLAETGTVFTNAYTPSPVCMPARQCLMAGQLPRTCGCTAYGDDLPPGSMTFARQFTRHGYMTTCAGKLHHTGWDQMQGWLRRMGDDTVVYREHVEGKDAEAFARHERDWQWSRAKEIRRAGVGNPRFARQDEYSVAGATRFLEEQFTGPYYDKCEPDRPLLLKVSLKLPHNPFMTTEERFTYYLNRVDTYPHEAPDGHPFVDGRDVEVGPDGDVTEREVRRATAAYYGMVETVDAGFRRVLDALEHVGEDPDEWVIVYTSDHGELLGEHGQWFKAKFYEGSVRVPLVIRWPERFDPGTVDANVNLCDLFATLCDLADLPVPEGRESRSLVPLLADDDGAWTDESVSQLGERTMVKRGDLKYLYHEGRDAECLFDLSRDPDETTNRAEDAAYADALGEFRERRAELGSGPDAAAEPTVGYR